MKSFTMKFDDEELKQLFEEAQIVDAPLSEYIRKLIRKGQTENSQVQDEEIIESDIETLLGVDTFARIQSVGREDQEEYCQGITLGEDEKTICLACSDEQIAAIDSGRK